MWLVISRSSYQFLNSFVFSLFPPFFFINIEIYKIYAIIKILPVFSSTLQNFILSENWNVEIWQLCTLFSFSCRKLCEVVSTFPGKGLMWQKHKGYIICLYYFDTSRLNESTLNIETEIFCSSSLLNIGCSPHNAK